MMLSQAGWTKRYVFVLLAFTQFSTTSELKLPDGRTIEMPGPNEYAYEVDEGVGSEQTITRKYALAEVTPNTALLCPKGRFIAEISQELVVNTNYTADAHVLGVRREHSASFKESIGVNDSPCPTLYRCLGFQACFFKFANEFCHRDPAPNLRKLLLVTVHCQKDGTEKDAKLMRDLVLHLKYQSRLEGLEATHERNYSATVIDEISIPEDEVFGITCPELNEAISMGYKGECHKPLSTRSAMSEKMGTILGRTKSKSCRSELVQVFCSYQFNPHGFCTPPLFLEQQTSLDRKFNYRSLPLSGQRPKPASDHIAHIPNALRPARLGFVIMLHKDMEASVQLIESIWSSSNFYVIHVDKRAGHQRKKLVHLLAAKGLLERNNLFVLPRDRSFATSWGSYDIVRAQLEGMEELLRRGFWDFAINLSGADLPIRDVNDLSAALAPHRGKSFLPFIHWKNDPEEEELSSDSLVAHAFHTCDDYVFKVAETAGMPHPDDLKLYNAPQWGVFAREFVEYLVDEKHRTGNINQYQYYLQTHIIPDESYLITVLMNSLFRNSVRQYAVHATKEFDSENADHLCRHFTDADFCGQGPALYDDTDRSELMSLAHRSFFARKFGPGHSEENLRNFTLGLAKEGYDEFAKTFLPTAVVWTLGRIALASLDDLGNDVKLINVTRVKILPSLEAHDECCRTDVLVPLRKMSDHHVWIDFTASIDGKTVASCRASLEPVSNGRVCYAKGDLKMAFVTSWTKDYTKSQSTESNHIRYGLQETMPLPFGPAGVYSVTLTLVLAREESDFSCPGDSLPDGTKPVIIHDTKDPFKFLVRLLDPQENTRHVQNFTFALDDKAKNESNENAWDITKHVRSQKKLKTHTHHKTKTEEFFFVDTFVVYLGEEMESGPWLLQIMEDTESWEPRVYNVPFYLLDYEDGNKMNEQLADMPNLWRITQVSLLELGSDDLHSREPSESEQTGPVAHLVLEDFSKDVTRERRLLPSADHYTVDVIILRFYYVVYYVWSVAVCYGGILTGTAVIIICHFWSQRARLRLRTLCLYFTALAVASLVQAVMLLNVCESSLKGR